MNTPSQRIQPTKTTSKDVPEILERTISEMRDNDVIWNVRNPNYLGPAKNLALLKSARKLVLTVSKLEALINYLKSRYEEETNNRQSKQPGSFKPWRWYEKCSFLGGAARRSSPRFRTLHEPSENIEYLEEDFQDISAEATSTVASASSTFTIKSEDSSDCYQLNELNSTSEVFVVDKAAEVVCKTENDPPDESPPNPLGVLRPKTENLMTFQDMGRNFIIEGICETVKFYLENAGVAEEDLVNFHSELIKYIHVYFKEK